MEKNAYLTDAPILAQPFMAEFSAAAGASILFFGIVRQLSHGKHCHYLEYEAYEPMAVEQIESLKSEALQKWPLEQVTILHRLGRIYPGEIAVAIDVRSAHRDDAYQASRFLIEQIKHQVPIWKKEYFEDGTCAWGGCETTQSPETFDSNQWQWSRERELANELF